jgi:hypothetical protein
VRGMVRAMRDFIDRHYHRQRELEGATANLHSAFEAMNESKRNLDAAIKERVEADPLGDFAKAARESRF